MAPLQLTTVTDQLRRVRAALTRPLADRALTREVTERRGILRDNLDAVESNRQELLAGLHARYLTTLARLPRHALRGVSAGAARSTQQPDPLRMCAQLTPTARALTSCDPEAMRWMLSDAPPPPDRSDLRVLAWALQDIEQALFLLASQLLRTHGRTLALLDELNLRLDRRGHIPVHLVVAVLRCQHALQAPDELLPATDAAAAPAVRCTSPRSAPQAAPTGPVRSPAGSGPATPAARTPGWRAAGSADHFAPLPAPARS